MDTSGDINHHILSAIKAARFGIVYFSESKNGGDSYIDNPNVLLEAGMMHSQMNTELNSEPTGWIPIRESESPELPFDIASQRTIMIERDNGTINAEKFKYDLDARIKTLIDK